MPLTHIQCQNAKPKDKSYKLSDAAGMYLEVMPNGSKYWRWKYRWLNKERRLALGVYPLITLAEAREKRDSARRLLAQGIDPSAAKRDAKQKLLAEAENTFEALAREWHGKQLGRWSERTASKILHHLQSDLFPYLGARPAASIEPPELLATLRKIEARGAHHKSRRIRQLCGQIYRYGIATGKVTRNPAGDLTGALTAPKMSHHAALDIKEMPAFLNALDRNDARLFAQTRRAIRLLMLTFTRTSELILARWDEIDFEKAQWDIPAERMKMKVAHVVPLSVQAVGLFREQQAEIAHFRTPWIFPNQVRPQKAMSNNTILFGIGRLGYKGRMTGHGFRSVAMTALMEELGYPHEIPDAQLAHAKGDSVRRAYDRTKYLVQRRKMMQEWADYLDKITIHAKATGERSGN